MTAEMTASLPSPVQEEDDEVRLRLVAAARELMQEHGIRRLRMDDVAQQAGCGRATLYRRFSTRDELVLAVVHEELTSTLRAIETDIVALPTAGERLVEAFASTVERIGQHPLLRRLLEIEPDLILPKITYDAGPVMDTARHQLVRLLRDGQQAGQLRVFEPEFVAEGVLRLAHSLVVTPAGPVPVDDPAALRRYARTYLAGPLLAAADRKRTSAAADRRRQKELRT